MKNAVVKTVKLTLATHSMLSSVCKKTETYDTCIRRLIAGTQGVHE